MLVLTKLLYPAALAGLNALYLRGQVQEARKDTLRVENKLDEYVKDLREDTLRVENKLDEYVKDLRGEARYAERKIQSLENRQTSMELYGIWGNMKPASLEQKA